MVTNNYDDNDGIDVTVPWSVCLSVTFLRCAQTE